MQLGGSRLPRLKGLWPKLQYGVSRAAALPRPGPVVGADVEDSTPARSVGLRRSG